VADRLNNLPLSYFIRALIPFIGVEPSWPKAPLLILYLLIVLQHRSVR
jgi:hypothetical protein